MIRLLLVLLLAVPAMAAERELIVGSDVSMLTEIEKAGGVFRDDAGRPADAIKSLRDHGHTLFRLRLFVDPDPDFHKTDGATQDLATARSLSKRIKAAGGEVLLDLHYADSWADPKKQSKPAAWKDLPFDELEQRVATYTAETVRDLQPDMVQVGNEITSGILWPDGKLAKDPASWQKFARLLSAGCRAVRAWKKDCPIVLHIHGGGLPGVPQWFFAEITKQDVPFDVIGLSFYPAWNDSIVDLTNALHDLAKYDKDILVVETGYAWRPVTDIEGRQTMRWPMSPDGQKQFVLDLQAALQSSPRAIGYVWWYPEAVPVKDKTLHIWRTGSEALFDDAGKPLPAMGAK